MEKKEGFDVLRLIEHGSICYISSEYMPGRQLIYWLKEGQTLKKEDLYQWVRDMAKQLMRIYRCQGRGEYGYVNPYCILISEDRSLYYLDMEAKSNQEILRQLSQDPVIRHYFTPAGGSDGRQGTLKEELYGMGKTLQYILSVAYIRPELTKKEERKLRKFISKCMDQAGKKEIRDVSELFPYLPEDKEGRNSKAAGGGGAAFKRVGLVLAVLVVIGGGSLVFKDKLSSKVYKAASEKEGNLVAKDAEGASGKQTDAEGTEGLASGKEEVSTQEKETLLDQSGRAIIKLALNYYLELENPSKALQVLEEALEENKDEEASMIVQEMQALASFIQVFSNPEESLLQDEDFTGAAKALELIKANPDILEDRERAWCLTRGYGLLAEKRKALGDGEEEAALSTEYANLTISSGEEYLNNIGFVFPTETTLGVKVDLLEKEEDKNEADADDENKENSADPDISDKAVKEIKQRLASAYEIKGNFTVAIEEWQTLLNEATEWGEREAIYLKLVALYEADGQTDKAIDSCVQGLEACYESWDLRKAHIRLLCADKGMDRGICAQTIKEYLDQYPDLKEDWGFKELQEQYGIKLEGETVTVK